MPWSDAARAAAAEARRRKTHGQPRVKRGKSPAKGSVFSVRQNYVTFKKPIAVTDIYGKAHRIIRQTGTQLMTDNYEFLHMSKAFRK